MKSETGVPGPEVNGQRRARADAERNRGRLLEAARTIFARDGAGSSLDDIARLAGVGSGTLYRHFPSREVLIEAVYREEVERLAEAATQLEAAKPPMEALRAWLYLFVGHVARKKLILPAMETVPGGSTRLLENARSQIHGSFYRLVERAIEAGGLRADVDPRDLLHAMIGIFHTTFLPDWEQSACRIVDLLLAGAACPRD